jgi:hypothetical protein
MKLKSIISVICILALLGIGAYAITKVSGNAQPVVAATPVSTQEALPAWGSKTLQGVALQMATIAGDSRPTNIRYVTSNRKAAATLLDNSRVDSDDVCYVVIMHGNFIYEKAFFPPGAKPPTGTTLSITVRASDGMLMDLALNNLPYSDLNQLGPITDIASSSD